MPRALKLLRPSGVILLHDYFPGLRPLWSDGSMIAGPYSRSNDCSGKGRLSLSCHVASCRGPPSWARA